MDRTQRNGVLLMLLASLGYAVFPILAKRLDAYGMGPLDALIWRMVIATPTMWGAIVLRRLPVPARPLPRLRLMALGSLFALAAASAFFGLQRMPASTYVVIFFSYPAFVVLFSILMGGRLPRSGWVALGMTLFGVFLTVPNFNAGLGEGDPLGFALAIFNAVIVAVYFLVASRLLRGHNAMTRASAWIITGSLAVVLVVMLFNGLQFPATFEGWVLVLLMGTFSAAMPVLAMNTAIKMIGPAPAAIINAVEPVMALILAMLLLGERMLPVQWAGAVLIMMSVAILQTRGSVQSRPAPVEASPAGD